MLESWSMKKLLAIVVVGLLWSGNALAEPVVFICKNIDGKEREYTLVIDLKKKIMNRAGVIYKIIKVNEQSIHGEIERENDDYRLDLIFNRFSGALRWYKFSYKANIVTSVADFSCKKGKKLI